MNEKLNDMTKKEGGGVLLERLWNDIREAEESRENPENSRLNPQQIQFYRHRGSNSGLL